MSDLDALGIALLRRAGAWKTLRAIDQDFSPQTVVQTLFQELGSSSAIRLIIDSKHCVAAFYALQYGTGMSLQEWWSLQKMSWGF